ncbi:hypothetical protein CR969_00585 [Candidatus Saccharibacteria bacterium]|nr:MAG: hypothetical protein CR969_00585 [Candidatus Saccharibacteria bacterium]
MPVRSILKKAKQLVFDTGDEQIVLKLKKKDRPLKSLTERELIQLESQIGATIFGEKPAYVTRREFFNLDKDTWIWYEEFINDTGKKDSLTTRYEVQEKGILKIQPNYQYNYIEGEELKNFVLAVKEYYERVARDIYHRQPDNNQQSK